VLTVLALIALGVTILNAKAYGIDSEGKILLKTIHVWFGYLFVTNLLIRVAWGFFGGKYARWRSILPIGGGYYKQLREYSAAIKSGKRLTYLGHNPIARLMISLMLALLLTQSITGIILAGTDVYMPPFGHEIRNMVAEDKTKLELVQPYSDTNINPAAYKYMRAWRKPVVTTHYWSFYGLLVAISIHIIAVIIAEIRTREGLVSAMFSGYKMLDRKPEDAD